MIITAGKFKGRKIIAPDEKITRPTLSKVRMGVFNTLFSLIGNFEGKTFLDLFGGSGIMGLEALSRGFSEVKVMEINKQACSVIKKNYQTLGLTPNLIIGDSIKLLDKIDTEYDVIYIDPPYESGLYETVIPKIKSGLIIAEFSENIDFSDYKILKQKNYGGKQVVFLTK